MIGVPIPMIPFFLMVVSILAARVVGALGVEVVDSWHVATHVGLAVMFGFTSAAHFNRMRADLIRMVPLQLPNPPMLVTLSGILELTGAVGLLVPAVSRLAAVGLALLLIALFPANVYAARAGLTLGGRPATPLVVRLPLQLLWIGLLLWIAWT